MFRSLKIKSLFLFMTILGTATVSAQEDVSDKELGQFADAYVKVQMQNQEAQQQMMTVIEEEGLKVERFSEIQEAEMDPNKTSDASAEEKKMHASAMAKIEEMQPALEKKAVEGIESTGITIERYQSLAAVIQNEKSLQQRLQTIMVERQGNE